MRCCGSRMTLTRASGVLSLLLAAFLLLPEAESRSCYDGIALGSIERPVACSELFSQGVVVPDARVETYYQNWELVDEISDEFGRQHWVEATVKIGLRVLDGTARTIYKSIHDNPDDIVVDQITIRDPARQPLKWSWFLHVDDDDKQWTIVQVQLPGDGLSSVHGIWEMQMTYRMQEALCRDDRESTKLDDGTHPDEWEEFRAPWANLWAIPVAIAHYSFTLPVADTFQWFDDAGWRSPWLREPAGFLSRAVYDTPAGKGVRASYTFSPSELGLVGPQASVETVAFAWARRGYVSEPGELKFPRCDPGISVYYYFLFLLLIIPCCCCGYFLIFGYFRGKQAPAAPPPADSFPPPYSPQAHLPPGASPHALAPSAAVVLADAPGPYSGSARPWAGSMPPSAGSQPPAGRSPGVHR